MCRAPAACAVRVVVTGQQVSARVLPIDLDPHPLLSSEPPSLGYIYHGHSRFLRISSVSQFSPPPASSQQQRTENERSPARLRPRVLGARPALPRSWPAPPPAPSPGGYVHSGLLPAGAGGGCRRCWRLCFSPLDGLSDRQGLSNCNAWLAPSPAYLSLAEILQKKLFEVSRRIAIAV